MILPQIPNIERTIEYTQEFKGYNHNLRIAENEFYDDYNISADNYPVLSTRKGRTKLALEKGTLCGAIGIGEDLYYILHNEDEGAKLYKKYEKNDEEIDNVSLEDDYNQRKMICFGSYLLIYPDGVYYNTANEETGEIAEVKSDFSFDIYLMMGENDSIESNSHNLSGIQRITENQLKDRQYGSSTTTYDIGAVSTENGTVSPAYDTNMFIAQVTNEGRLKNIGFWVKHSGVGDGKGYGINNAFRLSVFSLKVKITTSEELLKNKIYYDFSQLGAVFAGGAYCRGWYKELPEKTTGSYEFTIKEAAMPYSSVSFSEGKCYTYEKRGTNEAEEIGKSELQISLENIIQGYVHDKECNYDYIIECQNRLWACRYGTNRQGQFVNEIYATALGTFDDWAIVNGAGANSAYVASVGSPGPFTGVAVINQNPVFFKEDCIHKVYVSPTGAHKIVTVECQGVQESSSKSIAQVNGYIFYKTRNDVVIFDGTGVSSISAALGDMKYKNAIAGASGNKYVMYCEDSANNGHIFTYDTRVGIWHKEKAPEIIDMTVCDGKLYMISDSIDIHDDEASSDEKIPFMFETGDIGLSTPDKKYISRIDLRLSLDFGTRMKFWLQYDSDGRWIESGALHGDQLIPRPISLPILPRRCDHFRLKVTGMGKFNLYAMTKIIEQGE